MVRECGDTPGQYAALSLGEIREYISQVYGTGPLGLEYIDSHDDPRNASK
jgi:hypothetical protein